MATKVPNLMEPRCSVLIEVKVQPLHCSAVVVCPSSVQDPEQAKQLAIETLRLMQKQADPGEYTAEHKQMAESIAAVVVGTDSLLDRMVRCENSFDQQQTAAMQELKLKTMEAEGRVV